MTDSTSARRRQKVQDYLKMINAVSTTTDDYLYLIDYDDNLAYFTNQIHLKYQLPSSSASGIAVDAWAKTVYPRDAAAVMEDLYRVISGRQSIHNMEYRLLDRQGNRCWISCRGTVLKDDDGQPLMMLGRISDTVLGQKTDTLTGFLNGRKYIEDLSVSVNSGASGCLLLLGLDNFKDINMKYGRSYGNHLLKQFAALLEDIFDPVYVPYRLEGDRFALDLNGLDEDAVRQLYSQVQQATSFCTVSAGAVLYGGSAPNDTDTLYQYAESALDQAKKDGRNRLIFFSLDSYRERQNSLDLLEELRYSVHHDFEGFFLCYQPQIQCQSCRICGVEALLRFHSPSRGIVSPGEFIPLLEQSHLIVPVGEWVLRTSLAMCRKWRHSLPCLRLSVNLSYIQLLEDNITSTVLDILRDSGLDGDVLTLELTEGIQLQNYDYYNRIFYRWEIAGIRISIDDFGTGYSSLGYLKNLSIDEIKIDRCFVSGIQHNSYNYRLMYNTIELARSSQIHVCCEGVETEDELLILKELLPDTLQGFLFAAPCTPEMFERLYINSDSQSFCNRLQQEEHCRLIGAAPIETSGSPLYQKHDFESCIAAASRAFSSESNTYAAIRKLLSSVVEFYGADRAYIYEPVPNETVWRCSARWGTATPETVPTSSFDRWITYFKLGESVIIETINDVLSGSPNELELLRNQNITGLIAVPISSCGQTLGFIGVSNPSNHPANDSMLFAAAAFVGDRLRHYSADFSHTSDTFALKEVLAHTQLGLWAIRLHEDPDLNEMFADDVMLQTLGLAHALPPRECYQHWHMRINDGYYQYIHAAFETMKHSDQIVQVEYTWNHPLHGEVVVRLVGVHSVDHTGALCLCGYHRLISNIERPAFLSDAASRVIFEYNERKQSIYFHSGNELLGIEEDHTEHFPDCWIEQQIVHPDFADTFSALFQQIQSKPDQNDLELLLRNQNGAYEWFKARTRHLSQERQDLHTIIVTLECSSREHLLELESIRRNDFYEAMLSDTIAYVELDLTTEQPLASGGLWKHYIEESRRWSESFSQVAARHIPKVVAPEDQDVCQTYIDAAQIEAVYHNPGKSRKCCYRRVVNHQLHWVELSTHVFREHFTGHYYALLFLKDIDHDKKKELAQILAASSDPLTKVFNRSTFREKVTAFMHRTDKVPSGALILFDIDNFKQINDRYGHPEGDSALLRMTDVLQSTFRQRDIIGRLGGDEFVAFIKDVNDRSVLDQRMLELAQALQQTNGIPISFSAGIAFVHGLDFSYDKALKQADLALYYSKQHGKARASYYDDMVEFE